MIEVSRQETSEKIKEQLRQIWEAIQISLKNWKNYRDLFKIGLACTLNVILGNSNPWINASLTGGSVVVTYFDEQFTFEQNTRRLHKAQKELKQKSSGRWAINWPTYIGVILGVVMLVFYFMLNVAPDLIGSSSSAITTLIVLATALPSLFRKFNVSYIQRRAEKLENKVKSNQVGLVEEGQHHEKLEEQELEKAERMQALERKKEDQLLELEKLNQELVSKKREVQNSTQELIKMSSEIEKTKLSLSVTQEKLIKKDEELESLNQLRLKQQEEIVSTKEQLDKGSKELSSTKQNLVQMEIQLQRSHQDFEELLVKSSTTEKELSVVKQQLEEQILRIETQLKLDAALRISKEEVEKRENKATPHSTTFFAFSPKSIRVEDELSLSKSTDSLKLGASSKDTNLITRQRRNSNPT